MWYSAGRLVWIEGQPSLKYIVILILSSKYIPPSPETDYQLFSACKAVHNLSTMPDEIRMFISYYRHIGRDLKKTP